MYIDILYRNEESLKNAGYMSERTVYHLCLDKALQLFFPDLNRSKYFYSVLSRPLTSYEDIKFRQDIFTDFLECDDLFESLYSVFSKFKETADSHQRSKSAAFGGMLASGGSMGISSASLQMNALFLKRALLYTRELSKVLSKADIRSYGLIRVRDEIAKFVNNEKIDEAIRFASKFESISITKNADFKVEVGDEGTIKSFSLMDPLYVKYALPENKGILSFFKKPKEEEVKSYAFISNVDAEFYQNMIGGAYSELSYAFESWGTQVYKMFNSVFTQMEFYGVGLKYASRLKHYGTDPVLPEITDKKGFEYTGLRDILLILKDQSSKKVVPNDLIHDDKKEGLLIFGGNGSGKTVFLRSLATMQVLGQAGLPVPCTHAKIFPYKTIHTQFSEGEKMFTQGNDAGRFEQEVSEISDMVKNMTDDSLIILNETFQTTAYEEGAKGLFDILKYFSSKNVMWILVSHLTHLKEYYSKDDAYFMHTDGSFRVIPD